MTNPIGSFLLYSALMVLALVVVVAWRITHTLRCHFCHSAEVEQLAPTPVTLDAYDPEAHIPTVIMASRRGGRS